MRFKKNIELLINILEKSKINTLEVSSFWGFKKIKLSKDLFSAKNYSQNIGAPDTAEIDEDNVKAEDTNNNSIIKPDLKNSSYNNIAEEVSDDVSSLESVDAPLVGTVYLSAKPDDPQFVSEGDTIKKGQVICIIEAMKIFNEIESDKDGVVRKILVKNEDPIEFGQALIEIESQ